MSTLFRTILQSRTKPICLTVRGLQFTPAQYGYQFMKPQKKVDAEVAKAREARRRKRLEKEIRQMQKHSKKPKPIDEMTIDVKSSKNIVERQREKCIISVEKIDEREVLEKEFSKSRNLLQNSDDAWVRAAIKHQTRALSELKILDPELYAQAIRPSTESYIIYGPSLSPLLKDYLTPDGDYINTTRTWM